MAKGKLKAEDISNIKRKVVASTKTDKDGNYQFVNVNPGDYTIVAEKGDKAAVITDVKLKSGEKKTLPPWAIKTKGKIRGKVTLSDQASHSGILVYIAGVSIMAMTDTSGNYTLLDVPSGVYVIIATKQDYNDGFAMGIEVTPGQETIAPDIVLQKKTAEVNHSPVISDVSASPETIYEKQTSTITVTATDEDNDTLTYKYSVSAGTITGSGASVTYTAPEVSEFTGYNIKVVVSDGKGGNAYGGTYVFVKPTEITKLVIDKITVSPPQINIGQTATITVTASGGVPPYTYTYSATGGTITGSGSQVTYKAPDTIPGDYAIYSVNITVKDSIGQEEDGMVNLVVLKGEGQPSEVTRVEFTGKTITAYDVDNNKLWDYIAGSNITKALVSDVNDDSKNEVVFGTDRDGTDKGVLYVLNNKGQVIWTYKTGATGVFWPDDQMPIIAIRVADVDKDGVKEIVTLSYHYWWYPERLCVLNAKTGALEGDYWNPGRATSDDSVVVADLDNDGILEIIVGSGNNDAGNVAAVYCLKGNNVKGQAPPYYGNAPQGTHIWYANLGKPVNETYPYVSWVEVINDITGDNVKEIKCGGGTKTNPTYTRYIDGKTGTIISVTGKLKVTSEPPSATVYLSGEEKGQTPVTISNLQPGQYTLFLKRANYKDWTTQVNIVAGTTTEVSATLQLKDAVSPPVMKGRN